MLRPGARAQTLDLGHQGEAVLHVGRAVEGVMTGAVDRGQRVGVAGLARDGFCVGAERKAVITVAGEMQLRGEAHQHVGSERRRVRQDRKRFLEQPDQPPVDRAALVPFVDEDGPQLQHRAGEALGACRGHAGGHCFEQHRVGRAGVAAVVLGFAQRGEEPGDVVEVVAAVPREPEGVREPVHRFVVGAYCLRPFAGPDRELDRVGARCRRWPPRRGGARAPPRTDRRRRGGTTRSPPRPVGAVVRAGRRRALGGRPRERADGRTAVQPGRWATRRARRPAGRRRLPFADPARRARTPGRRSRARCCRRSPR